jgi:hypothetical protein
LACKVVAWDVHSASKAFHACSRHFSSKRRTRLLAAIWRLLLLRIVFPDPLSIVRDRLFQRPLLINISNLPSESIGEGRTCLRVE